MNRAGTPSSGPIGTCGRRARSDALPGEVDTLRVSPLRIFPGLPGLQRSN